jgi:hypothetical protein
MWRKIYWNGNKSDDEDNKYKKDVVMCLTYVSLETNLCVSYGLV